MTEKLLQFIWQFRYFTTTDLATVSGESLQILHPGQYNRNQGPDFLDAKVVIAKTTWAGSVEMHIKTSDWDKHHHQSDPNYRNVMLHVVWEDDARGLNSVPANLTEQSSIIPVVELKGRVSKILLQRYEELMNATSFIPCENGIGIVKDLTWKSWKDRVLAERLLRKASGIDSCLQQNCHYWEETFWWLLARNFGYKVNADAFAAIAMSLSVNLLSKHKQQVLQLEALLLGQAGQLENGVTDDYAILLQREYQFLRKKYGLKPIYQPIHFLRMRPGNFPTIRLAQLAMLINGSAHLLSRIKDAPDLKEVREWFAITANDYWHYHYRFDHPSSFKMKRLGKSMIDNIIINTIIPVLFAYGNYHNEQKYKDKALKWLEETTAEGNAITKGFQQLGVENKNAFDSQALIELKNEYCSKKRCLECGVGNTILKSV